MSNIRILVCVQLICMLSVSSMGQQLYTQPFYPNAKFPVTIIMNPCAANPCMHGQCLVMSFGYYCQCYPDYIGRNCEKRPDSFCANNPCKNGAQCTSTAGFEPYACKCVPPYTGAFCDDLEKIEDVEKVNAQGSNSMFLLNKTLEILKQDKIVSNTTKLPAITNDTTTTSDDTDVLQAKLQIVTNLLLNVSTLKTIEFHEPKVFFEIFDQVVVSANEEKSETILDATQKLSKSLEEYVSNINLTNTNDVFELTTDNLAVLSYKVNDSNETLTRGFTVQDSSQSIELVADPDTIDFNKVKSSAFLNQDVLNDIIDSGEEPIVSFAVYEKSTMFDVNSSRLQYADHDCSSHYDNQIITSVISVSTKQQIVSDEKFVRTLFRTNPSVNKCLWDTDDTNKRYSCVFWDYANNKWNSSGCEYSITMEGLHACECNHLTNFAVLMSIDSKILECETCDFILKYSSYAGSIASIICLSVLILFYSKDLIKKKMKKSKSLGFKSMFDYYTQVLISLSFSLLFMNMFYIVFSTVTWSANGHEFCVTISVCLHYFLLSSFCWMLSFAILQYLTFNKVFIVIKNYFLYASVFSLGAPLIPIITILSINWKLYEDKTYEHCWLSGNSALFGVIIPILSIIIINIAVFGLILKKHCLCYTIGSQAKVTNSRKQAIILATSFVNLGITWSMAFFLIIPMHVYYRTILATFFCILNSLQGFFLFLIYIVLTKSKRQLIKDTANEKFRKVKDIFSSHPDETNKNIHEISVSSKTTSLYNQSIYNSSSAGSSTAGTYTINRD